MTDKATPATVSELATIPIADIEEQIRDIERNGLSLAKYGGNIADEGRCRELCAMYLREFIVSHRMQQKLDALWPTPSEPMTEARLRELLDTVRYSDFPHQADEATAEIVAALVSKPSTVREPRVVPCELCGCGTPGVYCAPSAERIEKLTWQVRDTCTRAERAEGILRLARAALRQWTDKYAHLQNECGERVSRVLDYNLPPGDHLRALEAIEEHFKAGPSFAPSSPAAAAPSETPSAILRGIARNTFHVMKQLNAAADQVDQLERELATANNAFLAVEQCNLTMQDEIAALKSNPVGNAAAAPSEPCATCNDDPEVCATVPGLRHCEAANRQGAAPSETRLRELLDAVRYSDFPHESDTAIEEIVGMLSKSAAPQEARGGAGESTVAVSTPAAAAPHGPVTEYDGAFKCARCGASWGALPGNPAMPERCEPKPSAPSAERVVPCPLCGCGSEGMPCAPSANAETGGS